MSDKAKALLAEHRANWYYWNDKQRTNFLRRCRDDARPNRNPHRAQRMA